LPASGSARLAVVYGGWEQCSRDYAIDRVSFPYASIELVVKGKGSLVLNGTEFPLRPGTVFSYGPGISHVIRTAPESPMLKYFVDFAGRDGRSLLADCGLSRGVPLQLATVAGVRSRFDELIWLACIADAHTQRTCTLQFELLVRTIARATAPLPPCACPQQTTFTRCREYIDANFLSLSSMTKIAEACRVDHSYVCRVFREFHNESPLKYLHRLRMQWAADQLLSTPALVKEVAELLNMDPFHFSRAFKRVHGVSPALLARRRARRTERAATKLCPVSEPRLRT
jgi:AraC-like DNA-binding protein